MRVLLVGSLLAFVSFALLSTSVPLMSCKASSGIGGGCISIAISFFGWLLLLLRASGQRGSDIDLGEVVWLVIDGRIMERFYTNPLIG